MSFQAMTWATEQELPAMQKIVLLMMANRTNHDTGLCYPSHERLAKECGMSKRSLIDQISKLEEDGMIQVIRSINEFGIKNVNKYKLMLHNTSKSDSAGFAPVVQEVHVGSAGGALGVVQDVHINQEYINQEINHKDPLPTKAEFQDELFDKFYAAYPKKKGKDDAKKAWKKLKATDDLVDNIISHVIFSKLNDPDWIKQNGQFIPYPASYLNGKRWEDEINLSKNTGHHDARPNQPKTSTIAARAQRSTGVANYFKTEIRNEFTESKDVGNFQQDVGYLC